jgi:hypothetical protein
MTRRVGAVIPEGGFQLDLSLDRKRTALLVDHVSFRVQRQCHAGAKPTSAHRHRSDKRGRSDSPGPLSKCNPICNH